ncbi:MAG: 50S ribosomal protein L10 [Bifidobacteriaceae bacterium]|jgi:large subunit ribosomal protein L10|nr:50S ribosomal protein L10 [Bifidobacteriaceae bacterium]
MVRQEKTAAVEDVRQRIAESNGALLTEYRGLTVPEMRSLRGELRAHAVYAVVKNSLTRFAVKGEGIEGLDEALTGPTAIAFVHGDPVAAAKALREFARTHHALVVKGGILDGRALSAEEVSKLADLDSREVTLAKLAGVFKASLFKAAYIFAAPATKAVRTIDALREKQESAA